MQINAKPKTRSNVDIEAAGGTNDQRTSIMVFEDFTLSSLEKAYCVNPTF